MIADAEEPRSNSPEDIGGTQGWKRPSKPVTFPIAPGSPPKACRSCKATIYWYTHPRTGSKMPLNPDGTSHFSTCPNAPGDRKKVAPRAEQHSLFGVEP